VRATEVWQARDRHTCGGDGVLQRGEMNAGIASRVMRKSRQRLAVGLRESYLEILQPGHGNAAAVAERGDACMARIRGGRDDAFRTESAASVQNVGPFWKPEALR